MSTTSLSASRLLDLPPQDVFAVLSLPARHHEFDGSGFVRAADNTERITKAGQKFIMNMAGDHMGGEYRMHNHVIAFDQNKLIGWKPAGDDAPDAPKGWEWVYTLTPEGSSATRVTLTYDWSAVPAPLQEEFGLPPFPPRFLEESLAALERAVTGK